MKKKIIATITMLCLLTVLYNYLRLPDYHITNSISFSSADTRDTELTVIVYKCWEIDGLIKDIENEHNKINGTPTTLEIKLYYPTYYLHNNIASSSICISWMRIFFLPAEVSISTHPS